MLRHVFVPARHPHGLHASFLCTPQVADRIFCHDCFEGLNRVRRVAHVVYGRKRFLKNLRMLALFIGRNLFQPKNIGLGDHPFETELFQLFHRLPLSLLKRMREDCDHNPSFR